MRTFRQDFGAVFRTIRKSKGLNQDEVAERAGLSTSYISAVERGVANPKLDTVESLAKGIGVDPQVLFRFSATSDNFTDVKKRLISALEQCDNESFEILYKKIINIIMQ